MHPDVRSHACAEIIRSIQTRAYARIDRQSRSPRGQRQSGNIREGWEHLKVDDWIIQVVKVNPIARVAWRFRGRGLQRRPHRYPVAHGNTADILQVVRERRAPTVTDEVNVVVPIHPHQELSHFKVHQSHLMHALDGNSAEATDAEPTQLNS